MVEQPTARHDLPVDEPTVTSEGCIPASDGYPLWYRRYAAVGQRRGVILCIHGIQSHAGWYERSCRRMSAAGFEVVFVDRRGSGHNQRDRGHCDGHQQLCEDLAHAVAYVKGCFAGKPVILLAISWGGKLASATLKQRPDLVDGLVLVCPGWFAKVAPTLREKLTIAWSFFFRPRRLIRIPLSDPALFTATPQWQEYLRNDPLSLREGTARLLMTSRVLDAVIADAPAKITVPSLLMLAGHDGIIDNGRTQEYFERFGTQNRTVLEYPDAHHTLEFEPDPEPIFDDLIAWLAKNTAS